MKHTRGEGALVLALLALAACADPVGRTVAPPSPSDIVSESPSATATPELVALSKIARLVAQALDNEPARQHLKRDMRAAPFREHKLELTDYLQSKDGKALLGRMAELNGGDESGIFSTLSAIRPLEFYMPVAKHRESWTGKDDVLVVSQLDQWTPIVAFDEAGKSVALDRKVPPGQPTLALIPVETRFDQPMDLTNSRNARDENGEAIGTLETAPLRASSMVVCGDTCDGSGGGGGGTPTSSGLYLDFLRIVDAKEPWFRGDPEIEVHVQGGTGEAPTYMKDLSCSGEKPYDSRKYFDQNAGFWNGHVLLFSDEETVAFDKTGGPGYHITVWEDDNEPCTLKLDSNALVGLLQASGSGGLAIALKVLPKISWPIVIVAMIGSAFANAGDWLLTDDDFLGVAAPAGSDYPGNTHVILIGNTVNGRANIASYH